MHSCNVDGGGGGRWEVGEGGRRWEVGGWRGGWRLEGRGRLRIFLVVGGEGEVADFFGGWLVVLKIGLS